ncbi:MAG TPA: Panacea domain-containing protein [Rhodopseudomonas sp.]|uniref:Panacea domain-containing protein n=1 Tax=Rhodopseudomonas sp. TaxID=1078 RepID=UPI002EDBB5EA
MPGGQRRLREAILYVAQACAEAPFFGLVKLNKILWRADFDSFAQRGQPVTGRQYQRRKFGPAPVEMMPVLNELQSDGLLQIQKIPQGGYEEQRPVALGAPILGMFSGQDIEFLDRAIAFYWSKTGKETSDHSHGVAWRTREDGEAMPYELAYLSDEPVGSAQSARLLQLAAERGWRSK